MMWETQRRAASSSEGSRRVAGNFVMHWTREGVSRFNKDCFRFAANLKSQVLTGGPCGLGPHWSWDRMRVAMNNLWQHQKVKMRITVEQNVVAGMIYNCPKLDLQFRTWNSVVLNLQLGREHPLMTLCLYSFILVCFP